MESTSDGILMPLIQNRFMLAFENQKKMQAITNQVLSFDLDFVNYTAELKVAHPVAGNDLLRAIKALLVNLPSGFPIFVLVTGDTPVFCIEGCTVINHTLSFNYKYNEPVMHIFKIKFERIAPTDEFTMEPL